MDEIVKLFVADSPKLLIQLEQALLKQDPRMLELAAHTLKGQLQYLGAREAVEIAGELEGAGRSGGMQDAEQLLDKLRRRLASLWDEMSDIAAR